MAQSSRDGSVVRRRKLLLLVLPLGALALVLLVVGIGRQSKDRGWDQAGISSPGHPPEAAGQTTTEQLEARAQIAGPTGAESGTAFEESSVPPETEQQFPTDNLDQALLGLPKDQPLLPPGERRKAISLFSKERAMWDKIDSIRAEIDIVVTQTKTDEEERFRAHLSIDKERHKPKVLAGAAWTYHTNIKDVHEKWTFYTDGNPEGTRVECSDERRGAEIREALPFTVPWEIMAPQVMLVGAYEDELLPPGTLPTPRSKKRYFAAQSIRHPIDHTQLSAGYDFYTGYVPENVLAFRNGHVRSFGRGRPGDEPWKYVFDDYVQVGELWFPTLITVTESHGAVKRVYRFTELEINTPSRSKPAPAFTTE